MDNLDQQMRELLILRANLADLAKDWERLKEKLVSAGADPSDIDETQKKISRLDTETRQGYHRLDNLLG